MRPEIILFVTACLACFALAAHAEQIIATSVGAVPGDDKDDTAALQAALDKVSGKKNIQVIFPKGKYDFFAGQNTKNKHHALVFSDIDGLTIVGNGSEFLFHGLLAGFSIYKCKNVTLQGFVMDWPRPSFSVGEVIASEGKNFDVKVWDEFPVKGGEPVEAYMEYDPKTKLPLKRGLDVYAAVESTSLVSPQTLRVMLKKNIRNTDNAAIFISSAGGVDVRGNTIENVSRDPAHQEGRSAVFIENSKNVNVTGNVFAPAEGKKAEVTAGPRCDKDTITVKDNKGL